MLRHMAQLCFRRPEFESRLVDLSQTCPPLSPTTLYYQLCNKCKKCSSYIQYIAILSSLEFTFSKLPSNLVSQFLLSFRVNFWTPNYINEKSVQHIIFMRSVCSETIQNDSPQRISSVWSVTNKQTHTCISHPWSSSTLCLQISTETRHHTTRTKPLLCF